MGRAHIDISAFLLIAWAVGYGEGAAQKEILDCRCEYPLEGVYADPFSAQIQASPAFPRLTYDAIEDFLLDEGTLVIPQDHEACRYIQFVCDNSNARFPLWEGKCQIHPNERLPPNAFLKKGIKMGIGPSPPPRIKSGKGMGMMGMMKNSARVIIPSPHLQPPRMGKGMGMTKNIARVSIPSLPSRSGKGMGMMKMGSRSSNEKYTHGFGQAFPVQERSKGMMMKKKKGSRRNLFKNRRPIESQAVAAFEEEVQYRQQTWYAQWGEPWRAVVLPSGHPYCVPRVPRDANSLVRDPKPVAPTPGRDPIPSIGVSVGPTQAPVEVPTRRPSVAVPVAGTIQPLPTGRNPGRTSSPSEAPTEFPSDVPSSWPSLTPSSVPSFFPTPSPTRSPTKSPTPEPTLNPTPSPTPLPTDVPTMVPIGDAISEAPSKWPSVVPSSAPSKWPSVVPSSFPTETGGAQLQETVRDNEASQSITWQRGYPPTSNPTEKPTESPVPPTRQVSLGIDNANIRVGDIERTSERDEEENSKKGKKKKKDDKKEDKKDDKKDKWSQLTVKFTDSCSPTCAHTHVAMPFLTHRHCGYTSSSWSVECQKVASLVLEEAIDTYVSLSNY
eukprot:scaffold2033_cov164-Amphora_coffeaeformis.AAC.29